MMPRRPGPAFPSSLTPFPPFRLLTRFTDFAMFKAPIALLALVAIFSLPAFSADPKPAAKPAPQPEPVQADPVQAELAKWQGLWQTSPGGIEHQGGQQVVRNPVLDGPCFFVFGDRLIWLTDDGRPTGQSQKISLDVKADPKRVTLTPLNEKDAKPTHGIYSATGDSLMVNLGLDHGPAPKQFLDLNNPKAGNDGEEWLVSRKKLKAD